MTCHRQHRRAELIDVLERDWDRVRSVAGGLGLDPDDGSLAREAVRRGISMERAGAPPERVDDRLAGAERSDALRRVFAWKAASVAVNRFDYVTNRDRFARTGQVEQQRYERKVELDRDVVPDLKLEAKALREEVGRLEDEARRSGVDPASVEPAIDWSRTIAVDAYQRPEYETNESRRAKAVEFFRRLGP